MVSDARALLPTDLLTLVARAGSPSYENQAWPRERLGTQETQPTLSVLRDQLLAFSRQRTTWVCARRQKLQALVGARQRGGAQAWEIDYLIECGGGDSVLPGLIEKAVKAAGAQGAEKLFLRLEAESGRMQPAREAGFMPYVEERLYVRNGISADPAPGLRNATPADSYPLFRLYAEVTPEPVRRHEAATYSEWQAGTERRWQRGGIQLLSERDGSIEASVRAARLPQGVLMDLTLRRAFTVDVEGLIAAAARELDAAGAPLLALVPSTDESLARCLEDAGFSVHSEFVSLMHRTTRPLTLPKAMPAVAKNVVGA